MMGKVNNFSANESWRIVAGGRSAAKDERTASILSRDAKRISWLFGQEERGGK